MHARLEYQAGHAIVWRDAIVQYFLKLSGIPDEKGRAGNFPGRLEAEDARLTGYKVIDVTPWEDASRGKAVSCEGQQSCTAEWTYNGQARHASTSPSSTSICRAELRTSRSASTASRGDTWAADANLPSNRPNGDNSTRHTAHEVTLKPGDVIRVEGRPDKDDPAALDYIEVQPASAQ